MTARKLILILALTLGVGIFGATRGLAYMQETYAGVCSPLEGIPGLLQKVNLLAMGNCNAPKNNKCAGSCTLAVPSGKSKNGTCTYTASTTPPSCQCVAL